MKTGSTTDRTIKPPCFSNAEAHAMDAGTQLARSQEIGGKISRVLQKRTEGAQERFRERLNTIVDASSITAPEALAALWNPWKRWAYAGALAPRCGPF